jgi:tetratricopeptide (TPR) repeat protein
MIQSIGLSFAILALLTACSHTPESVSSDELNLNVVRQSAGDADQHKLNGVEMNGSTVMMSREFDIDWKKFFQPAPDRESRNKLSQKLAAWQDSGTASDYIKKAQAELTLGRFTSAEVHLQKATRIEPENGEAWLELAKLALRKRDPARSMDYLGVVRKIIDKREELSGELVFKYKYILSLSQISAGERDAGHKGLSELIAIDKSFVPAYSALATSYLNQGKMDAAKFIAERGLDRGKEDASILNVLGVIALKQGKLSASRSFFERSLKQNPDYSPALINHANLAIRNFEYESAELSLQKAINANPDNSAGFVALGLLQRKTGRTAAATESLQKALDLDPGNGNARFNLAMIKMQETKGRSNDALRLLLEVTQTDQSDQELKSLAQFYIDGIQADRAH